MAYFESKQKFASVLNTCDNHSALVFALNTTRYKQYESTYADYEIIQIICKQAPCITTVIYNMSSVIRILKRKSDFHL